MGIPGSEFARKSTPRPQIPAKSIAGICTVLPDQSGNPEFFTDDGLKPGDKVEVRATASGGVYIEKAGDSRSYRERLEALAKQRLIRDITTDEFMKMTRGDPADDPPVEPQ